MLTVWALIACQDGGKDGKDKKTTVVTEEAQPIDVSGWGKEEPIDANSGDLRVSPQQSRWMMEVYLHPGWS